MESQEKTIQMRWMELVVAALSVLLGAIVIKDSFRTGFAWGSDGPQPGYFPFYIGLILVTGAIWVAIQTIMNWKKDGGEETFATVNEFNLVLKMLVPTIVYVVVLIFMGLYVSSILFIAFFMIWQGKYSYVKSFSVGFVVCAILFALFELWFLVPLPKGPIEALFGY
jgi:putative tricarboxylic transport membrane protein